MSKATTMKLIAVPASPFARKVRVVLAEKRLPYEFILDSPSQPGSRVSLFNPLSKIPVLLTAAGEPVYDSSVIVDYLEAIAPTPALLPADPLARIAVKRWEALADGILDAAVLINAERRRVAAEQSAAWVEKQTGKIRAALAHAAEQLAQRDWCYGDRASLADISVVVALCYLDFRLPELEWQRNYANLARLQQTLQAWSSFAETQPKEL